MIVQDRWWILVSWWLTILHDGQWEIQVWINSIFWHEIWVGCLSMLSPFKHPRRERWLVWATPRVNCETRICSARPATILGTTDDWFISMLHSLTKNSDGGTVISMNHEAGCGWSSWGVHNYLQFTKRHLLVKFKPFPVDPPDPVAGNFDNSWHILTCKPATGRWFMGKKKTWDNNASLTRRRKKEYIYIYI